MRKKTGLSNKCNSNSNKFKVRVVAGEKIGVKYIIPKSNLKRFLLLEFGGAIHANIRIITHLTVKNVPNAELCDRKKKYNQ